jgi:hypothetical protein
VRLPLSSDVKRALVTAVLVSCVALPLAAETWQARDVASAERYRAEERARAERYRAALEEKANARPAGGAAERVGEAVAEKAQGLGESLAAWLGEQLATQIDELLAGLGGSPTESEWNDADAPRGLREWLAREQQRADELLRRDEVERER